jgi:hypothetical protein
MTNEVRELFEFVASDGEPVLHDHHFYGSVNIGTKQQDVEVRITEMVDGLIVSKSSKKITYLTETKEQS